MTPWPATLACRPDQAMPTSSSSVTRSRKASRPATTTVWAPGTVPLPPKRWSGRGRPTTRLRRDARHQPVSVKDLAVGLSKRAWRTIEWREGTAEPLVSRFARVRARVAHRDDQRTNPRPPE